MKGFLSRYVRWSGVSLFFALSLIVGSLSVQGGTFNCGSPSCNNDASCTGDLYSTNGCSIQCYNYVNGGGANPQITPGASGTCTEKDNAPPEGGDS